MTPTATHTLTHDPSTDESPSTELTVGVAKERVDPYTLEIIEQLFPGQHGIQFLAAILRLAMAKQIALPDLGLSETADVAVITVQSLRVLSRLIGLSYETTEKYVVLFCRLRLLHKKRYRRKIVLSFPLGPVHLPEPQALDYRSSVQSFASQVKRRFVLLRKSGQIEPSEHSLTVVQGDAQRLDTYSVEKTLDAYQGKQLTPITDVEASLNPRNKGEATPRAEAISTQPEQHHPRRSEARVIQFHNKRAGMVALPATLTLAEWKMTLEYFHYKCADFQINDYQVFEHFIPLTSGGGTTQYNCVPACGSINSAKGDQHPRMLPPSSWIAGTLPRVQKYLKTRETAEEVDS